MTTITHFTIAQVPPGWRLRFDDKATVWLVRAETANRRYSLATASLFGAVHYTIIDWQDGIRGPMNVIGGGLSIFTTDGYDPAIDEAIGMLEEGIAAEREAGAVGVRSFGHWSVSRRYFVPLVVGSVMPPRSSSGDGLAKRRQVQDRIDNNDKERNE